MNVRDQIVLNYAGLADGESIQGELCPACNGGNTREGTLKVTNDGGLLLWICYRASCGEQGGHRISGASREAATKVPSPRGVWGRTLLREAVVLPANVRQLLQERYGIDDAASAKAGIGWDETTQRVAIPVRNFQQEDLGCILRAIDGQQPKTLSHVEQGAISWFTNRDTDKVIIVEDQFSAIRASHYLTSVALLGTNLNEERLYEIRRTKPTKVYLALDPDAFAVSVKYATRFRSLLPMTLVKLPKDVKDMAHEELEELISGI